MRTLALLVSCLLAVPARAQPDDPDQMASRPPSKTLERAIKLYDKQDFYSATIELQKVLAGETGDDVRGKQRAEFFVVKTYYQMGFYAPSLSRLAAITQSPTHPYFGAVPKWLVALTRVAPNPSVRSVLFAYRGSPVIDDPINASVRDELAYQLGRELVGRDVPAAEVVDMLARVGDPVLVPRAQLETARVMFRGKNIDGGIAWAMRAARSPELAVEATRLIASSAHVQGAVDRARAPLAELAKLHAYARYQHSRAMLDGRPELPGMERVSIEVFDAVMLPSACRGRMPDDVKPIARQVIGEAKPLVAKLLAVVDNTELFDVVRRLQRSPSTPGGDVVLAAMADPDLALRFAWLDEIDHELGMIQRTDRAWQTTPAASEILQELTVLQSLEAAEIGVHARERLAMLDSGLDALGQVLAGASPAFALSAGPEGLLHVESELCQRGGTAPIAVSQATKPTTGCAGCATHDQRWSFLVLVALVLVLRRRAAAR